MNLEELNEWMSDKRLYKIISQRSYGFIKNNCGQFLGVEDFWESVAQNYFQSRYITWLNIIDKAENGDEKAIGKLPQNKADFLDINERWTTTNRSYLTTGRFWDAIKKTKNEFGLDEDNIPIETGGISVIGGSDGIYGGETIKVPERPDDILEREQKENLIDQIIFEFCNLPSNKKYGNCPELMKLKWLGEQLKPREIVKKMNIPDLDTNKIAACQAKMKEWVLNHPKAKELEEYYAK